MNVHRAIAVTITRFPQAFRRPMWAVTVCLTVLMYLAVSPAAALGALIGGVLFWAWKAWTF